MKTRTLIGLAFLLFSCGQRQGRLTEQSDSLQSKSQTTDTVDNAVKRDNCNSWLDEADSTLLTGDFVKYIKENGRIRIEWGNRDFKRTLGHDFDCDAAPSWIPTIRWSTSRYIGLGYSCGSPCWGTIILPINSTDSVVERMYDLEEELSKNLIVYLGGEDYDRLTIENWATGEKQEVKSEVTCESAFLGYCIDSLRFVNDNLFIKWDKSAGQRDKDKKTSTLVKLEI